MTGPRLEEVLAELRARGRPVALAELARRLLAGTAAPPPAVARRVVGAALDLAPETVPDPVGPQVLREPAARAVAEVPLEEADFAVVDLETTGLSAERAEIMEIGAVRVRRGVVAEEFSTLVRPSEPIPERIARLTGIEDAMVADAPELAGALRGFRSWLSRTPRAPFLAHNARFDAGFVRVGLERCGLPPLEVPVLCTRKLGRRLAPEVGRYGLDHLCAHFGVSNAARHRALGDARATARIWVELLSRARERGVGTLGDLLDFQERPLGRRRGRRRASSPGSLRGTLDRGAFPRGR